jgi:ribosomal protein S27AE
MENTSKKLDGVVQAVLDSLPGPLTEEDIDAVTKLFRIKLEQLNRLPRTEAAREEEQVPVTEQGWINCLFIAEWDRGPEFKSYGQYNPATGEIRKGTECAPSEEGALLMRSYIRVYVDDHQLRLNVCPGCFKSTLIRTPGEVHYACRECGYIEKT